MKAILNNIDLKAKALRIRYFFSDVDGTLTDGSTYYSARGEEMKKFSHIDGTGFFLLRRAGIIAGLITGENTEIVKRRAEKLQLDFCFVNISDKYACLQRFAEEENCELSAFAYIGDDINDCRLLNSVGLSFAPVNARKEIKNLVDIKCNTSGGHGAFREAVELLLLLRGNSGEQII